ncbi:MAG TPA: RNA methyltransferase [Thermoleophilia bacterium]|nr:RNA methyltransferase [Thermoleophilia bacterium]
MVAAALAAGWRPQVVFLREDVADELGERLSLVPADPAEGGPSQGPGAAAGPPAPGVFVVSDRVAARLSTLETPVDAVAVLPLPERRAAAALATPAAGRDALVVCVDGLQDPGNVGTLIRAAAAFGASAVVTSQGAADPYGPKTVRASMGALFALPVVAGVEVAEVVEGLPDAVVYGLDAHRGEPLDATALTRPAVLVVGAERAGLSAAAARRVDHLLTIPLAPARPGAVESLNAGVAGAIALYEFARRSSGAAEDPSRRADAAQEG